MSIHAVRLAVPACTRKIGAGAFPVGGGDECELHPIGVTWTEEVSRLPVFELRVCMSEDREIVYDALLGQRATVELATTAENPTGGAAKTRKFTGVATAIEEIPGRLGSARLRQYVLRFDNWLWFLSQRSRCRIFQNKSVVEILKECLDDDAVPSSQLARYDLNRLSRTQAYAKRRYCVQYNETDFDFLSRLLEDEGIYYFVGDDGETVCFADDSTTQTPATPSGWTDAAKLDLVEGGVRNEPCYWHWRQLRKLTPAKHRSRDFSFLSAGKSYGVESGVPQAPLRVGSAEHSLQLSKNQNLVLDEYPAGAAKWYDTADELEADNVGVRGQKNRRTQIRAQETAVQAVRVEAIGNFALLAPGYAFSLHGSGSAFDQQRYLAIRLEHECVLPLPSSDANQPPPQYHHRLECIPAELAYRPRRLTPKPNISGTQTALVVGPKVGEIETDLHGRVKVLFPWAVDDWTMETYSAESEQNRSCWLRVSQPWAGAGYGMITIPRVGHEVVVGFENGDPDAPIILGSVFNSSNRPPYELPANRSVFGFKSSTFGSRAEYATASGSGAGGSTDGTDNSPATISKGFNGWQINDSASPNEIALQVVASGNMMTSALADAVTAVQTHHQVHVGDEETHVVGAGLGLSKLGFSIGIAPCYRPGKENTGNWRGDVTVPIVQWISAADSWLESLIDPRNPDAPWDYTELQPSPLAKRLDMTMGSRVDFAYKQTFGCNSLKTNVTSILGGFTSALNFMPASAEKLSKAKGALKEMLQPASELHYIQDSYFFRTGGQSHSVFARGRSEIVGAAPFKETFAKLGWMTYEFELAAQNLIALFQPYAAGAWRRRLDIFTTVLETVMKKREQISAAVQRSKALLAANDTLNLDAKTFEKATSIANISQMTAKEFKAQSLSKLWEYQEGKIPENDSYQYVRGMSFFETGKQHAIVAEEALLLQSRAKSSYLFGKKSVVIRGEQEGVFVHGAPTVSLDTDGAILELKDDESDDKSKAKYKASQSKIQIGYGKDDKVDWGIRCDAKKNSVVFCSNKDADKKKGESAVTMQPGVLTLEADKIKLLAKTSISFKIGNGAAELIINAEGITMLVGNAASKWQCSENGILEKVRVVDLD